MKLQKPYLLAALSLAFATAAEAGPVLVISGMSTSIDSGVTWNLTRAMLHIHEDFGNAVTVSDGLPVDVSGYEQIWDLRFSNSGAISAAEGAAYGDFLRGGGGLFLIGEHGGFMGRNNSILDFIASLGGGSLGAARCQPGSQNLHPPFGGPNASTFYGQSAGCFSDAGTGEWIASKPDGSEGSGIAFDVGMLSGAPDGVLISFLDTDLFQSNNPTARNFVEYMNERVSGGGGGNAVPEPGTIALASLGLFGLAALRRRR